MNPAPQIGDTIHYVMPSGPDVKMKVTRTYEDQNNSIDADSGQGDNCMHVSYNADKIPGTWHFPSDD